MKKVLLFFTVLFFMAGCQQEKEFDEIVNPDNKVSKKGTPISSTYFNWEDVNQFNGHALPWVASASSFIPEAWKHEHKKEDGWELIYNTLDRSEQGVGKYIALYNKYLGILRFFYKNTTTNSGGQKYCLAASIKGSTILLNNERSSFNLTPISNPTLIKTQPFIMDGVNASFGYAPGAWYGTEFKFEYENISGREDVYLVLLPYKALVSNVKLQSETTGSITGTITTNASAGSGGSLINLGGLDLDFSKTLGNVITNTSSGTKKIAENIEESKKKSPGFWRRLWGKVKTETPGYVESGTLSVVKKVVDMGINWASNPILNFAKNALGIGGSSTPTVQDVKLSVKTQTVTTGTIDAQEPLGNYTIPLPTTNYKAGGYGYPTSAMQNFGLGVWSLSEMPIASIHRNRIIYRKNYMQLATPARTLMSFRIKNINSIRVTYNPKVLADCEVVEESIKYSFRYDRYATNSNYIYQYGTPFKYENGEYFELNYTEMYDYASNVSSFTAEMMYGIEAHVAITLRNRQTGKLFNHVKSFKLPVHHTNEVNYKDIGGGDDDDFPVPPDEL